MPFRVGQARPRNVALTDVEVGGAEVPQPVHFRRLVVARVRQQVEVGAVGHGLRAGCAEGFEVRSAASGGAQRRLVVGHFVQGPVRRLAPEPGHGARVRAVDHYRGDGPGVAVDLTGFEHAELVALGVGEDRPRDVALSHVDGGGTESAEACDQLRPVGHGGGGEVDVQPVLRRRLGLRDGDDVDPEDDRVGPDEAAGRSDVVGDAGSVGAPAERLGPEVAERPGVDSLDVRLYGSQGHVGDSMLRPYSAVLCRFVTVAS